MKPYVLVVDDEADLLTLVRYNLERDGFEVGEAVDGEEAMTMIAERRPDLVRLAPTEFRLLRHFMEHPGRVFSREQLLDAVWGREIYLEPRTVDVHVQRLRRTLNTGGKQDIIRTVRAAGYAMDEHA